MDGRAKVELFEQIRREHEHGGGSIRGIAKKLGIHRRMVREALASAVPRDRKVPVRARPKLGPVTPFIEAILETDQKAPRKQRHTAHRIWCRIQTEMPEAQVGECTVRRYVRRRKIELRLASQEPFVPQSCRWGEEGQVDWYEAYVDIAEERQKAQIFPCAAWPVAELSIVPFPKRTSRHFWKGTSKGSLILGAYLKPCAMTTSAVQ